MTRPLAACLLALVLGCGESKTTPSEKPPPASDLFDKKEMPPGQPAKGKGIGE